MLVIDGIAIVKMADVMVTLYKTTNGSIDRGKVKIFSIGQSAAVNCCRLMNFWRENQQVHQEVSCRSVDAG